MEKNKWKIATWIFMAVVILELIVIQVDAKQETTEIITQDGETISFPSDLIDKAAEINKDLDSFQICDMSKNKCVFFYKLE